MHTKPQAPLSVGDADAEAAASRPKRRYTSPRLERLGDIRSLTLGGSPGHGDTGGGGGVQKKLGQAPALWGEEESSGPGSGSTDAE